MSAKLLLFYPPKGIIFKGRYVAPWGVRLLRKSTILLTWNGAQSGEGRRAKHWVSVARPEADFTLPNVRCGEKGRSSGGKPRAAKAVSKRR